VTGESARDLGTVARLAARLRDDLGLDAILVKLSEEGMLLLPKGGRRCVSPRGRGRSSTSPARATPSSRRSASPSGGADSRRRRRGREPRRGRGRRPDGDGLGPLGGPPRRLTSSPAEKLLERGHVAAVAQMLRRAHRRVVFTNGCFDLLHPGHVTLLGAARKLGDVLVVGLNSDASVKRLKGPERPILSETDRAQVLGGLDAVDFVVLFDEDTPEALIHEIRPQVLVKGATTPRRASSARRSSLLRRRGRARPARPGALHELHGDEDEGEGLIDEHLSALAATALAARESMRPALEAASAAVASAVRAGRTVLAFGNGGSATQAQHFAAELVVRYKDDRPGLPSIALTCDGAILTACANDYSYDYVFARQVEALGRPGDVALGSPPPGPARTS